METEKHIHSQLFYSEGSSYRDATSGGNLRQEDRDRFRYGEWNPDRAYSNAKGDSGDVKGELFPGEEQVPSSQSQQQPASYPLYNCVASAHPSAYNNNAISMMFYNGLTMTVPWGPNQLNTMPMNSNPPAMPMSMRMEPGGNCAVASYSYMDMSTGNLWGVVGMGNCQYGMTSMTENLMCPPVKDIIQLTKCVLYPPNILCSTSQQKPLGCKTVFVDCLPEKATEEIIKEIFERCGQVEAIRMEKKFCHIRFSDEMSVENAVYLSGYRIKIENKENPAYNGRLHVRYAEARDDKFEYECKQRALQRKARHEKRARCRSATPPVVCYSEHEASLLVEKLRHEETFAEAVLILTTWLERGACTKRNSGTFYSMIQSMNNHVSRLSLEKAKYEKRLNEAKKMLKNYLEGIMGQFTSIGKLYKAVCLQKVWDHFSKTQRKNIELWHKQTEELRNAHLEEVINEREDEEMELSEEENEDKENGAVPSAGQAKSQSEVEIHKLRAEVDSLKCQIEMLQNNRRVT